MRKALAVIGVAFGLLLVVGAVVSAASGSYEDGQESVVEANDLDTTDSTVDPDPDLGGLGNEGITGSPDPMPDDSLAGTIDIDEAGDVAEAAVDLPSFCEGYDVLGYDLALSAWESGFQGAAEPFGFSDQEIFDELVSRCTV